MKYQNTLYAALIVTALVVMAITLTAGIKTAPATVTAPHVEINEAWMHAMRLRDYEAMNNLTCHPSERTKRDIEAQVNKISAIVNQTSNMQLTEVAHPDLATQTVKVTTTLELLSDVGGKSTYAAAILLNTSTSQYCVIGFALDRAFWPSREQVQE
jgi:hypothetical protein